MARVPQATIPLGTSTRFTAGTTGSSRGIGTDRGTSNSGKPYGKAPYFPGREPPGVKIAARSLEPTILLA